MVWTYDNNLTLLFNFIICTNLKNVMKLWILVVIFYIARNMIKLIISVNHIGFEISMFILALPATERLCYEA